MPILQFAHEEFAHSCVSDCWRGVVSVFGHAEFHPNRSVCWQPFLKAPYCAVGMNRSSDLLAVIWCAPMNVVAAYGESSDVGSYRVPTMPLPSS